MGFGEYRDRGKRSSIAPRQRVKGADILDFLIKKLNANRQGSPDSAGKISMTSPRTR